MCNLRIPHAFLFVSILNTILGLGCSFPNGDPFLHYPYPASIAINLNTANGQHPAKVPATLLGTVEARTGTLRNLHIYFESSDDLSVQMPEDVVDILHQGEEKSYQILTTKGKGKPDAGGSWVRIRVTYLPDYTTLLNIVSDPKRYPPEEVRSHYVTQTERAQQEKALVTDAARVFFE